MVGSEVEPSLCDSTGEGNATRPLWARGGRYLECFLGCPFQGKKTPVPPRGSLLGFIVIGFIGASMNIGGPIIPHLGIIPIASWPLIGPFGKASGLAVPGCQTVIVVVVIG